MPIDPTGPAVMVAARGAVWWGYAVERRGKREAWLIQSPDGGFRYASIHATLYHYDPKAFAALAALHRDLEPRDPEFEKEWRAIVDRLELFSPKST